VDALRGGEGGDGGAVEVRVLGHVRLDLGAQLGRDGRRRRVGHLGRVLREVDRVVPAGHARAVAEARDLALGRDRRLLAAPRAIDRRRRAADRLGAFGRSRLRLLLAADHRSIPPSTGSSIASVAIRSAM